MTSTAFAGLLAEAHEIAPEIVADRRAIHAYPELAFNEHRTAAMVAGRLRELGVEVREGIGKTGVVGLIRGGRTGKTVLLRADMDALPVLETNEAPYASESRGLMHACGHDGHTAMLLGAAKLLSLRRNEIRGNVKLMFQPGEEGGFGALRMIEDGVLEDPRVDGAFGLHVAALHYAGQVGLRAGATMAAADRFEITVTGRGGHAARPEGAIDPIVISAHIITALQTIVSRNTPSAEQAVVTVGSMTAGTTHNVIPGSALLKGTFRTYSPELRQLIERRVVEVSTGIAEAMGGKAECRLIPGYRVLVNHPEQVEMVRGVVRETLGPEAAIDSDPVAGAEDFSYLLERVPGAFFFLGVRHPGWETPRPNHGPDFDMDESALPIRAALLAGCALRFLEEG